MTGIHRRCVKTLKSQLGGELFSLLPVSDRSHSAIPLYTDDIEKDFLRADRMPVFSHSLHPFRPFRRFTSIQRQAVM
jgi:hypothetical protein